MLLTQILRCFGDDLIEKRLGVRVAEDESMADAHKALDVSNSAGDDFRIVDYAPEVAIILRRVKETAEEDAQEDDLIGEVTDDLGFQVGKIIGAKVSCVEALPG